MKRQTIYTASLNSGKIIKAKTRAKLRKLAPHIRKIWMDTSFPNKQRKWECVQWSNRFYLDKFLRISTKGRYRVEVWKDPTYNVSDRVTASGKLIFRAKFTALKKFIRRRSNKS